MKPRLLRYLCCPNCRSEFRALVKKRTDSEIISGSLACKKCKKTYSIIKGVPVILEGKKLRDFSKTKKNWENWWEKIRKKSDIELYDKLWVQAENNLGAEPLYRKQDFTGKIVLDAGCGTGRYIKSDFSKYNCKEIIGVDIGNQVFEAKKQNNAPNTHFIQVDLTNLPFKKQVFDVIASHGVLHHTPKPEKTFGKLSKHLKTGGMMAIYVYHKEWAYYKSHRKSLFLDTVYAIGTGAWLSIRWLVSRMPHPIILGFVYLMALKSSLQYVLEKNKITKPLGTIIKFIPPFAYIGVNFHERLVRNYDHYSATFNYFQSIDEVVDWFRENNFNNIEVTSVPVSMRGIKTSKQANPLTVKEYKIIDHFTFRKEWEKIYAIRKK